MKRKIVAEANAGDVSVAEVARRHGVNANLVHAWKKAMTPPSVIPRHEFVPLRIVEASTPEPEVSPITAHQAGEKAIGMIEITLANGTRLRCDAAISERTLRRVLTLLKTLT